MRITVIFMISAIVVCAMVQKSEQLIGRSYNIKGGLHIDGSITRNGWGYQECPIKILRNICKNVLAIGGQETKTSYTPPNYETTMPYTDYWNYWNQPTTTTARPWEKK